VVAPGALDLPIALLENLVLNLDLDDLDSLIRLNITAAEE
jgi:hypothetical protein